jgi:hypothetical protein
MIRTYITPTKSVCNIELNFPKEYLGEELEILVFKKAEGFQKGKTKKSFAIVGNSISHNEFKNMIEDAEKGTSISLKESKKIWIKRRKALEKITP